MLKRTVAGLKALGKSVPVVAQGLASEELLHWWRRSVPDPHRSALRQLALKGTTLYLYVVESIWIQELSARRGEWLRQLVADGFPVQSIRVVYTNDVTRDFLPVREHLPNRSVPQDETVLDQAARLHAQDRQLKKHYQEKGFRICDACGLRTRGGATCPGCARRAAAAFRAEVESLLRDHPWLTFQDVRALLPDLRPEQYELVYRRVESAFKAELFRLVRCRRPAPRHEQEALLAGFWHQAMRLAALWTGKPPKELNRAHARSILVRRLPKVLQRMETHVKKV